MKKKTIFLLLILTGILPIACCPENPSGPYLLEFKQVYLYNEASIREKRPQYLDNLLAPNSTYAEDTLVISLDFTFQLAYKPNNFSLLSSAYALSCDDYPNLHQLNDKIKDITVTSDSQFNDVVAGEPLNQKVVSFNNNFNSPISLLETVAIINSLDGNELMNSYFFLNTLAITEKPTDSFTRTFTVTINYESGKQEVAVSQPIVW